MTSSDSSRWTNRLAREKSPYLLQHQYNPVDWHPWGEEAFAKARGENKPIFLSVGYSTCHWCHVMERESFENEDIARMLNENFVSIKVDREERPDVDRVYMTFVQATTGSGGWPMNVFLTPDLKPFAGGTYFPPQDAYGRPGFATLLRMVSEAWKNDRSHLIEQGDRIIDALTEHAAAARAASGVPGADLLDGGAARIARDFDSEQGGFGPAPKFPRPSTLYFLFRIHARKGARTSVGKEALEMSLLTLQRMAAGGIRDHLGGGFHRYSVDRYWHVPHFEKMLYDQAQLAIAYAEAFQITRKPLFEQIARDILDYVRRDLTAPEGGFHSAEDADSLFAHGKPEHGEGAFYTWSMKEIENLLGPDAAIFNRCFGVESGGNAPPESDPHGELKGRNTLIRKHTAPNLAGLFHRSEPEIRSCLARSTEKLFQARSARPRPHLDDKIITAWNGLMISGFARAAAILDEPVYLESATRAAVFIRASLWDSKTGRLLRSYREGPGHVAGFVDDYASLIQGLLDLYEAAFDLQWLKWAIRLQEVQDELFFDRENGGYFSVPAGTADIFLRMKEDYDGAEPSPNSVSALNLLRLAAMTGVAAFGTKAERTIQAFMSQLENMPNAMPQMLVALDWQLSAPRQIVITGRAGAPDTAALAAEVHRHFQPKKVLLLAGDGEEWQWFAERLAFLREVKPPEGKAAAAYMCENFACLVPVSDPVQLGALLKVRE